MNVNLTFCSRICSLVCGADAMGELLSKALETGFGKSEGSAHMAPHERLITLREVLSQSDYQQDTTETIWVIEKEEAVKAKDIHKTE